MRCSGRAAKHEVQSPSASALPAAGLTFLALASPAEAQSEGSVHQQLPRTAANKSQPVLLLPLRAPTEQACKPARSDHAPPPTPKRRLALRLRRPRSWASAGSVGGWHGGSDARRCPSAQAAWVGPWRPPAHPGAAAREGTLRWRCGVQSSSPVGGATGNRAGFGGGSNAIWL